MRQMSKREALEACLRMWKWLAETGGTKEQYFIDNRQITNVPIFRCYACQYVRKTQYNEDCLEKGCILKWPKSVDWDSSLPCCRGTSPFWKWSTSHDVKTKKKEARKIVKLTEKALKELG